MKKSVTEHNVSNFGKRMFSAFLGVVAIEGVKFLVFCEEAKVVCPVDKFTIFEISSLIFMSLLEEKEMNKMPKRK